MAKSNYDLIIIGGGPAGLAAGIYASRARIDCILLERMMPGGQVLATEAIENYPGFSKALKGSELISGMVEQARALGLKIEDKEVLKVSCAQGRRCSFIVETDSKKRYEARSLIIASGAAWKKLGVPGEDRLNGKGVSYCATCDAPFFKGRDIAVVGGGDKALEESLYLAKIVNSVKLIHRRDRFRAVKELQERVFENKSIEPLYNCVVTEIGGDKSVEFARVLNKETKKIDTIPCSAVFIFIGIEPNSRFMKGLVDLNDRGFVITDNNMKTSLEGVFACGDVIKKDLYQIVTAVGEGATAAFNAERYLEKR